MSDPADTYLRVRFEALAADASTSDWADVERRVASAPTRRRWLAAAAVIALLAAAAPAAGLHRGILDFFESEPAPRGVQVDFAQLDQGAPEGMAPGVIEGEARKVMTVRGSDGARVLWVAPTRAGGFCVTWTGAFGGCDRDGKMPLSVSWSSGDIRGGIPRPAEDVRLLAGFVRSGHSETVEVRHADGSTAKPTITWVSAPIGAGFFYYEPRAGKRRITSVVALDGDGNIVAEQRLDPTRTTGEPPAEAILDQRTMVIETETAGGAARIWRAPTRYGGSCYWIELQGAPAYFMPCLPRGEFGGRMPSRFLATRETALLAARVPDGYSLSAQLANGATSPLDSSHDGFVLWEVPPTTDEPGQGLVALVLKDAAGKVENTFPVPGDSSPPCLQPRRLIEPPTDRRFCLPQP